MLLTKNRCADNNKKEKIEKSEGRCSHLIFDKDGKILNAEEISIFTKLGFKNQRSTHRKIKLYLYLFLNKQHLQDLNHTVKPEMVKHLKEWFSTHLMLFHFKLAPHVMMTANNKVISLLSIF